MTTLDRLRNQWFLMDIPFAVPASQGEVAEFEQSLGVLLPREFANYLVKLNGMSAFNVDDELNSFWPLARIRDESDLIHRSGDSVMIPIADYLIHSLVFLLKIDLAGNDQGVVEFRNNGEPVLPLAESFSHFVERYLTDHAIYAW